jgi:hypothetical protein
MKIVEDQRGVKLEPWQEFDMIGGTSTGGYGVLRDIFALAYSL